MFYDIFDHICFINLKLLLIIIIAKNSIFYPELTFVDPQSQNLEAFLPHPFFLRTQHHLALLKLLSIRLDHSSFHHYFGSGEPVWQVFLSPALGLCTGAKMWRDQALNLKSYTILLYTLRNYNLCVSGYIYAY